MKQRMAIGVAIAGAAAVVAVTVALPASASSHRFRFSMVRSAAAAGAGCLAHAQARVEVVTRGVNETLTLHASGLPKNTGFDLFVTQVPNAPFGVAWYQSDLQSDRNGRASVEVIGRFNVETFAVAPGTAPAPNVHPGIDATSNPAFAPVHMYHLGFWFNKPKDAVAAGCPGATTPFNGDHTAGVQAMSTRNFPDNAGPLRRVH